MKLNSKNKRVKALIEISQALVLVLTLSACTSSAQLVQPSASGLGGDSWKEEVLLHDGQKIIAQRSQSYGGRHEIGQSPPVKEHTITFSVPGSDKSISWTSEYGQELGRTNFNLLALHVQQGTPYLVVEPNLCLSYNKWGRPNPPYVFFKYDGSAWQRIALEQFPLEFNTINLIVNDSRITSIKQSSKDVGYVPLEAVKKINADLRQPEYKTILREALPKERIKQMCDELIRYKGRWIDPRDPFARGLIDSNQK